MGSRTTHFIYFIALYQLFDFLYIFDYFNARTSIGVFTRFYQPSISLFWLKTRLKLLVFLLFLLLFDHFSTTLILLLEFFELFVLAVSNMESHGNVFERIDFLSLIVIFQVHK